MPTKALGTYILATGNYAFTARRLIASHDLKGPPTAQ